MRKSKISQSANENETKQNKDELNSNNNLTQQEVETEKKKKKKEKRPKLSKEEKAFLKERRKQQNKKLYGYFAKYKWQIMLYILCNIIDAAVALLDTMAFAEVIRHITNSEFNAAIYNFLFIIGLFLSTRLLHLFQTWLYLKYSIKIMADLNYDIERQAFKLTSQCYSDHGTGTFVQRIVNDPERLVRSLSNFTDIIINFISTISIIIYVFSLNVWVSLTFVGVILLAYIVEFFRLKYYKKTTTIRYQKNEKIHSLTTEIVKSSDDIKSLGLEDTLSNKYRDEYNDYKNYHFKTSFRMHAISTLRRVVLQLGTVAGLILGIYLNEKSIITLATFMIIYSNRGAFTSIISFITNMGYIFADLNIAKNRIFQLFDEEEFSTEKFGDNTLKTTDQGCTVEFKNVGYSYKEYKYDEKETNPSRRKPPKLINTNEIFNDLNFKIESNTSVAFVGKSGSGKSTILKLISKMIDTDNGNILINDQDIKSLTKESVRSNIALVNQFPYIFDATIKENLLMANKDATDKDIQRVLKESSLDEFISTLPEGINTKVGEGGIKLSGGQRQRLAISRALLKKSSIILFDESTSSLDNFAQETIKQTINNLKGKTTVVVVAHRLSTIKDVDKIYYLEDGKITDSGTFDELYNKNATFQKMFLIENI